MTLKEMILKKAFFRYSFPIPEQVADIAIAETLEAVGNILVRHGCSDCKIPDLIEAMKEGK
jgi:hypothetical protein